MLQQNIKQDKFIVDLNGFDGPLELLLSLAQKQKVDLKEISITELVDQYLLFVKNVYYDNHINHNILNEEVNINERI